MKSFKEAHSAIPNTNAGNKNVPVGSDGIRTHAPEETGALNQRLGPLGHATTETQIASRVYLSDICPSVRRKGSSGIWTRGLLHPKQESYH